jgi:hypothetical protein
MSWIMALAVGTCMVILVGGLITALLMWVDGRNARQKQTRAAAPADLEARLSEIERRLTDTQEVMLALSEKLEAERTSFDTSASR